MTGPSPLPVPPAWAEPLHDWTLALHAAHRSLPTIKTRTDHVRRISRALGGDPWQVTSDQLIAWAGRQNWTRETRRSVYFSARGFWSWALMSGRTSDNPAAALPSVRPGPAIPRPAPELAVRAAILAADPRVELILRLAAELGLRRAEIAQIHHRDLVPDLDGWSIIVHGKGDKDRLVPMPDPLAARVRAACAAGYAFPGADGGHLSPRWVGKIAAKVLPEGVTLHMLRHRCATQLHDATGDLISVQRLLGHASVATTQRYVLPPAGKLRRALAAIA